VLRAEILPAHALSDRHLLEIEPITVALTELQEVREANRFIVIGIEDIEIVRITTAAAISVAEAEEVAEVDVTVAVGIAEVTEKAIGFLIAEEIVTTGEPIAVAVDGSTRSVPDSQGIDLQFVIPVDQRIVLEKGVGKGPEGRIAAVLLFR